MNGFGNDYWTFERYLNDVVEYRYHNYGKIKIGTGKQGRMLPRFQVKKGQRSTYNQMKELTK